MNRHLLWALWATAAVLAYLGTLWFTRPSLQVEELRQQLGECLKKQPYVQCTVVDARHDLCERRVR